MKKVFNSTYPNLKFKKKAAENLTFKKDYNSKINLQIDLLSNKEQKRLRNLIYL